MATVTNQIHGESLQRSTCCLTVYVRPLYFCLLARRQYEVNELYNFETWGRQLSAFIEEIVKGPAFLICNSVGGKGVTSHMLIRDVTFDAE